MQAIKLAVAFEPTIAFTTTDSIHVDQKRCASFSRSKLLQFPAIASDSFYSNNLIDHCFKKQFALIKMVSLPIWVNSFVKIPLKMHSPNCLWTFFVWFSFQLMIRLKLHIFFTNKRANCKQSVKQLFDWNGNLIIKYSIIKWIEIKAHN